MQLHFTSFWTFANVLYQLFLTFSLFLFWLDPLLIPFSPLLEVYFLVACQVQDSRWQRKPCTSSLPINIWSDVSVWHDIFHLQDYVAATSFSCVTRPHQFARYHVSRANDRYRRKIMHERVLSCWKGCQDNVSLSQKPSWRHTCCTHSIKARKIHSYRMIHK